MTDCETSRCYIDRDSLRGNESLELDLINPKLCSIFSDLDLKRLPNENFPVFSVEEFGFASSFTCRIVCPISFLTASIIWLQTGFPDESVT